MDEKAQKTFCVLPWIHSFVNSGGEYQVCCTGEEFGNTIVGDNAKNLNIDNRPTIDQVMNSKFMKTLRLKMLNGKWDPLCTRCKITEDNGGHSRRIIENKAYKHVIDEIIANTEEDGTIHNDISFADYRLGNLCNLQCRMCSPYSTRLWIREWNKIKPLNEQYSNQRMHDFANFNWIDSDVLVHDFKLKAHGLDRLHFAGGEPLIAPQMAKILKICVDSGSAKKIVLSYNTNLTKLPPPVIELWKEFKEVRLLASIDAVGELNTYIRYPSKWKHIDNNLRTLDEYHKEMNVTEVLISTTVQILNILHLNKLYKYLDQFQFIKKAPNLINLHIPHYFQSTYLPKGLKQQATENLLDVIPVLQDNIHPNDQYLIDNIGQIVNFMNGSDFSHNFATFLTFQENFDRKRNISLFDVLPELGPYSDALR